MSSSQHQVSTWQSVHQTMTSLSAHNVECTLCQHTCYYMTPLPKDDCSSRTSRVQWLCFYCCLAWHQIIVHVQIALKAPACSNAAMDCLELLQHGADNQRPCCIVCAESFSSMYGYCMAIAAPGFGLATLGLGPSRVHWWGYLLLLAACSSIIAALMYNKLSRTGLGYASRSAPLCACFYLPITSCPACIWST